MVHQKLHHLINHQRLDAKIIFYTYLKKVITFKPQIKYKITDYIIIGNQFYFIDETTHKLRVLNISNNQTTCLIGNGRGFKDGEQTKALLNQPTAMCLYDQKTILIADKNGIRQYSILNKKLTTLIQYSPTQNTDTISNIYDLKVLYCNKIIVDNSYQDIIYLCDRDANVIYQCDIKHKKAKILAGVVNISGKQVNTLNKPMSICQYQNEIIIADTQNNQIKSVKSNGIIQLLSSKQPGYIDGQYFSVFKPTDLIQINDKILIVDCGNNTIRILDLSLNQSQVEEIYQSLAQSQSQSKSSNLCDSYSQFLQRSNGLEKSSVIFNTQIAIPEKQILSVIPTQQTGVDVQQEKQISQNEEIVVDQLLKEGYTQTLAVQDYQSDDTIKLNLKLVDYYSKLLDIQDFNQEVNDVVSQIQLGNSIGCMAEQTEQQTLQFLQDNYNQFLLVKLEDSTDQIFSYPLEVNKQKDNQFICIDQAEQYKITINIFSKNVLQQQQCFIQGNKIQVQAGCTIDIQDITNKLQFYKYQAEQIIDNSYIKDNIITITLDDNFYQIQLKPQQCEQYQQNLLRYYYVATK